MIASSGAAESFLDEVAPEPPPGNPIGLVAPPDACLRDVMFIDAKQGWAVGDWGAIWHTADGGKHWEQQFSGVDCRLESVHFLDANQGWAAGGFALPRSQYWQYWQLSTGVILHTVDGGWHWTRLQNLPLPSLRSVKFFDQGRGLVVGARSALFPDSIYCTTDRGKKWTRIDGREGPYSDVFGPDGQEDLDEEIAVNFASPESGVIVSQWGLVRAIEGRDVQWASRIDVHEIRNRNGDLARLRRIKFSGSKAGWAVGDAGLVYRTSDGGRNWDDLSERLPLPAYFRESVDYSAIAAQGVKAWITGSPGSAIYYSPDNGISWNTQTTRQSLPLRALSFIDDQHGWAVGEFGTILATDDGGETWRQQRSWENQGAPVVGL